MIYVDDNGRNYGTSVDMMNTIKRLEREVSNLRNRLAEVVLERDRLQQDCQIMKHQTRQRIDLVDKAPKRVKLKD